MAQPESLGRPTFAEINLAALEHNYRALAAMAAPARVMGIVKANGYGHDIVAVARRLAECGCDYFGVAIVEEGIVLRAAGLKHSVLVMGGLSPEQIPLYLKDDLQITVSSLAMLGQVEAASANLGIPAKIQVKIDTGMERMGVPYHQAEELLAAVVTAKHCKLMGVYSHLASADCDDPAFTELQIERFLHCTDFFSRNSLPMPLRHLANSAGAIRFPHSRFDMVRPGISLYGVYPRPEFREKLKLYPVMSLKSQIVLCKTVKAGSAVGYGGTWKVCKDTQLATIPIGYGDGYSRRLSNCGEVLIGGKRSPIRGTVSMDQIMVEVADGSAREGDPVVVLGKQGSEEISAEELAQKIGTISYEVITGVSSRVPRVYVNSLPS